MTKQEIDALVEALGQPNWFSHGERVTMRHIRESLYLAAGLNADGSEKAVRVTAFRTVDVPGPMGDKTVQSERGTWDGTTFTPESTKQPPLCLSCGKHKERCDGC